MNSIRKKEKKLPQYSCFQKTVCKVSRKLKKLVLPEMQHNIKEILKFPYCAFLLLLRLVKFFLKVCLYWQYISGKLLWQNFFFVIFQAKNCITFHLKFQVSIYFLKCRSFRVRSGAEAIFQPIASP